MSKAPFLSRRRLHFGQQERPACIGRDSRPFSVAVRGLAHDVVESLRTLGIALEQLGIRTDVAGEEKVDGFATGARGFDLDRTRAQEMTCPPQPRSKAGCHGEPVAKVDRAKLGEAQDRVFTGIDRLDGRLSATRITLIELLHLHFLDMAGVRQHDRAQVDRARRCENRTGEAVLHEFRNKAAVVDMGVAEHHRVDIGRTKRKGPVIEFLLRLGPLHHAAVDQNLGRVAFHQEARPGDGAASPMKMQAHDTHPLVAGAFLAPVRSSLPAQPRRAYTHFFVAGAHVPIGAI